MAELKILLMTSIDDEFQFSKYFPEIYESSYIITELLILTKYFKKCGKGCLLSKDKIYFYKTFVPNTENSINKNKGKIFLLFYCDSTYKQKYIDEFTINIFDLLEKDVFEDNKLKTNISKAINELFDIYKNIKNKEQIYGEYVKNIMKNIMEEFNGNNNILLQSDSLGSRRRFDSRIIRNRESSLMSIKEDYIPKLKENIELVKIKEESESILTMIFRNDKYSDFSYKMKKIKKFKIINIIIFTVIGIVMYILLFIYIFK